MHLREKEKISYSLIIILMLFSQNTMLFSPLASGKKVILRMVVYVAILAILFVKTLVRERMNRYLLCGAGLLFGTVFISMLLHADNGAEYWLLVMLISLLLVSNYDMLDFAEKYIKMMKMLCIFFLSVFFLLHLKQSLILSPLWLNLEAVGIVAEHSSMLQYYQMGIVPMRAYGIYREPGVYQMYVLLAMLICMYIKKNFMADFLIYSLAVLTTHSTTGYICLLLIYCVLVLKIISVKDRNAIIVLAGIIVVGCAVAPGLVSNIIGKFTATGINAHSWMSRFASFSTNIYLWMKNPLLGIGITGVFENFADVTQNVFGLNAGGVAITDNTNSIFIYFAAYGLLPGSIFCIGIWKWIRKTEKSKLYSIIIMIMFVCLFAGEQVNNTCYPYILIFEGFAMERLKI